MLVDLSPVHDGNRLPLEHRGERHGDERRVDRALHFVLPQDLRRIGPGEHVPRLHQRQDRSRDASIGGDLEHPGTRDVDLSADRHSSHDKSGDGEGEGEKSEGNPIHATSSIQAIREAAEADSVRQPELPLVRLRPTLDLRFLFGSIPGSGFDVWLTWSGGFGAGDRRLCNLRMSVPTIHGRTPLESAECTHPPRPRVGSGK